MHQHSYEPKLLALLWTVNIKITEKEAHKEHTKVDKLIVYSRWC